jgi:hypothetical protein
MIRHKYVEEQIPEWIIFGERRQPDRVPRPDDAVDLADVYGDVYVGIPRHIAERLDAVRRDYQRAIIKVYEDHPDLLGAYQRDPRSSWNNPDAAREQQERHKK